NPKIQKKCPVWTGFTVQLQSDWVSSYDWIDCPVQIGFTVQFTPDFAIVDTLSVNHQFCYV
ncbi:MAG: hypothetical protein LLF93_00005, partial [Bacteroidales bacterium]|nr:hypothetical protein [Bacteroidales bacterium]